MIIVIKNAGYVKQDAILLVSVPEKAYSRPAVWCSRAVSKRLYHKGLPCSTCSMGWLQLYFQLSGGGMLQLFRACAKSCFFLRRNCMHGLLFRTSARFYWMKSHEAEVLDHSKKKKKSTDKADSKKSKLYIKPLHSMNGGVPYIRCLKNRQEIFLAVLLTSNSATETVLCALSTKHRYSNSYHCADNSVLHHHT